ncbi:MAG: murein biosynthesis integral membrane protein MurJ [Spirochaetales bacterium]|nr:murein biosynthesis integral membrane protein MurJ [Spirochaetales bacterium]
MDDKKGESKSILSTLVVSLCTLVSRILGFVKLAVIAKYFGGDKVADIINFTFNIPNNLRKLMAEGALSSAFVPVLSDEIEKKKDHDAARKLVQNVLALQFIIVVPITILCFIFSRQIMGLISTYEGNDLTLAADLFKYFMIYLLLISLSAVLMGTINTHAKFLIPALTPILFSIFVIVAVIVLYEYIGAFSMVVGVLSGGVAQIFFQLPQFFRLKYSFVPSLRVKSPGFKRVLINWVPILVASSIFSVTQIIANALATSLPEGSVTALNNSIVFFQLPLGIFSIAITTVLFPKMSRQFAVDDVEGVKSTVVRGLNMMFMLLVPSMIVLIFFGKDMISAAFVRGFYTQEHAILAADVLIYYSIGLFFVGSFNFLNRFFYSRKNFSIPLIAALIVAIVDISLSIILMRTPLEAAGLALANTISFFVGFVILFFFFRNMVGKLNFRDTILDSIKITISMVPLFFLLFYSSIFIEKFNLNQSNKIYMLVVAAVGIVAMILVLVLYRLTKVSTLAELMSMRRRKKP